MANTTFTGNVRANGDGSRNTRAGSMQMVATFHVPNTNAAAGTACQVSATDTSAVVLPNNCIVDKIVFKGDGAGGAVIDIGYADISTGAALVNTDGFADNIPSDGFTTHGLGTTILPGGILENNAAAAGSGVDMGIVAMTQQVQLVAGVAAGGGAGTMTGSVYYHINDAGNESA
tara:strand:+ start:127 stop:648 length:522 start_codon:yes stop_codon:yes gene_type:complete